MQCVILVAGEGTRMYPLTLNKPKPLIKVGSKTILDHIIDALPAKIDELILVVGYKGEQIREHCGDEYKGRKVCYIVQEDPKAGTGDALFCAESVVTGKFLMMYGDDIHGAKTLESAIQHDHCILASHSNTPEKFGVLELNENGTLKSIIEKPKAPPSNLVNIGGAVLTHDIFSYKPPLSKVGEYYITDSITDYAQIFPVDVIEQDLWLPIGYPDDIEKAETVLENINK